MSFLFDFSGYSNIHYYAFLFRDGLTFLSSVPHPTPPLLRAIYVQSVLLCDFLKNGIPTNKLIYPVYRVRGRVVRP